MNKKTVLITGAKGNIGRKLTAELGNHFKLRLLDLNNGGDTAITAIDLGDWSQLLLEKATGVDAILHLAADPHEEKSWVQLCRPNLDAVNNVFMAATLARVPRLIYFSSNHVMGGYKESEHQPGRWLTTDLDPRPGTRVEYPPGVLIDSTPYGAMKLAAERSGIAFAKATSGVFIGIRSGWVLPGANRPEDLPVDGPEWYKRMWLATPDLLHLVERSIEQPLAASTAIIVNGMSDNDDMVWDIDYTRQMLGFQPEYGLTRDFQAKPRRKRV